VSHIAIDAERLKRTALARGRFWLVACGLGLPLLGAFSLCGDEAPPAIVDGQVLALEARSVAPAGDFEYRGVMKVRRAGSPARELPVVCGIKRQDGAWRASYQVGAPGQQETLTILQGAARKNEYLLATNGQAQPQPVTPSQMDRPLAGTDFDLSDLGREYLFWPGQKVLRAEMRKGRACRVLQSTPAVTNLYACVLSWVDVDTAGVVMAESYGPGGALVKEFEVNSVKKVNEVWHPQRLEVRHPQRNSRTLLEFDFTDPPPPKP